jgi:hypothetical protein
MKTLVNKMPKTINEILSFEGDDEMGEFEDEMPEEEPEVEKEPETKGDEPMDIMGFVDDIRKKSLKGMASLAETPEDERYQLLKKIWQICDKKPEQQTAFGNPVTGQQPGVQAQQPVQQQQNPQMQ